MIDLKSPEIDFAIQAVRQASILVQFIQTELVSPALTKDDRSPVTVADFVSQALIGNLIKKAFPGDPLVAEEDSETLKSPEAADTLEKVTRFVSLAIPKATSQEICNWIDHGGGATTSRFWALDPIDGTKGFLRGDQYVVAFALIVNGIPQIGVLGCPKLTDAHLPDLNGHGSLVVAALDQGTWTTDLASPGSFEQLRVSSQSNPVQARLLRSFESGHTNVSQIDRFSQELGIQAQPVRMDSQAKYAVLAAGKGELLLRLLSPSKPDYREKIWDQAAGSIILQEAGGRITDLDGKSLDFRAGRALINNRGILASNNSLHEPALNVLKAITA
jgi:3'(2'), 5'-bisphosphate nucleotidase